MAQDQDPHQPLRDDVRLLGHLLGDTIRDQAGQDVFDAVESVRAHSKAARAGDEEAARRLRSFLGELPVDTAVPLARSFSVFLTLANIAEQHHRVRRRRDYQRDPDAPPQRGSIEESIRRLRDAGIEESRIRETLARARIELVLTAHPTEATRRTLLAKHQRIAGLLEHLDHADLTPTEREEAVDGLRREILGIWRTPELRPERPTPEEEARSGFAVVEKILWDALPRHLREVDLALRRYTESGLPLDAAPIRFASWMGGDRDGNPNVTPETTHRVVLLARWMAAYLFHEEVNALRSELSLTDASPDLRLRVGDVREPYRELLRDVRSRLEGTMARIEAELDGREPAGTSSYERTEELWEPLHLAYMSLQETGARVIADGRLLDILRRVSAFGLYLLPLDLRQHAARHEEAVAAIATHNGHDVYAKADETARFEFLEKAIRSIGPDDVADLEAENEVKDVLDTLRVAASLPRESLGAYVVSMASRPSDVLGVYLLQRAAGLDPPLRVVPLYETLDDLTSAATNIERLLQSETYRRLLPPDGLEVMLGYSDSAKDAGLLSAHWHLYRAQEDIVAVCREAGVPVTLFHGRGGTVGRGGAPAHAAILAQPPGSVDARLRVTEQGEAIQSRFGQPGIALRTLELYTTAVLEATLRPPSAPSEAWRSLLDRMAAVAKDAHRGLVEDEPRFVDYFHAATPVRELGLLNIGSRPARRGQADGQGIEDLRAIPWVFGWTQNRAILPGWFGVGEALGDAKDRNHQEAVRDMGKEWPFFQSFLDMVEMVLAKVEPRVTAQYDEVLVPPDLQPIGRGISERYEQAVHAVLDALGHEELLEDNRVLQRSIIVRNPYVDPLNLLQVEFLRRSRQGDDPVIRDALLVTMKGVANGMRNTG